LYEGEVQIQDGTERPCVRERENKKGRDLGREVLFVDEEIDEKENATQDRSEE